MEDNLTKDEYAEARDAFAKIARNIEELEADGYFETEWMRDAPVDEEGRADYLDEQGFYITGAEYRQVKAAARLFERLAGRNAARAL